MLVKFGGRGDLLLELHGQAKWKLCTSSESKLSEKCCQKILSLALRVWNDWSKFSTGRLKYSTRLHYV